MIRQPLVDRAFLDEEHFRWRGREVGRLESLADVVFGFSLTLLVAALEVPKTSRELFGVMHGFFAFAICFTILIYLWSCHYIFFRRYGLADAVTLVLNAVLLFLVLLYVYPLKFLFTYLTGVVWYVLNLPIDGGRQALGEQLEHMMDSKSSGPIMVLYSAGYLGVATVFMLLYAHAWRLRERLSLDERERIITRAAFVAHGINGGISTLSIVVAYFGHAAMAGFLYLVLGPIHGFHGYRTSKRLAKLT